MFTDLAILTRSIKFCLAISMFWDIAPDGLGTKSTTPKRSASKVIAPSVNNELSTTVGVGDSIIICRKLVKPSMTGISISKIITSGFKVLTIFKASSPFLAAPTASIFGSDFKISKTAFLMNAESSTTSTLIFFTIFHRYDSRPK
jgi:hypothetical protein